MRYQRPDFFPNIRELGKGEMDVPEVMGSLREIRHSGRIDVEQEYAALTPPESCHTGMNDVREVPRPIYS